MPEIGSNILVRATNWLGDAVMSLPAIRALREAFPAARLTVVARPWVADLYARETAINRVILYQPRNWRDRRAFAARLRSERSGEENFDCAILLQNAFEAALIAWMARIPTRIGYRRDGRSCLLTIAIPVPDSGDIPRHERFYYLELLRRAKLISSEQYFRAGVAPIQLEGVGAAQASGARQLAALGIGGDVIGISPGAAYGNAKRWLPERFAEAAVEICSRLAHLARRPAVLVFGSAAERPLSTQVAAGVERAGIEVRNLAGQTSLREFIDLAAACRVFLTNDSGAMHVASALGVPTAAVFGATDDTTTGPAGPFARVIREHAPCSPCLLRECPIDHRCMTRVSAPTVARAALELWEESATRWT
ncbi:MAG TPA: lipopolysaccharide heptosyltransferase II, partial [Bryobacteraceae bacterium]|nr:lipopolysaccharide heptosyltransferase II [Bryobacteraceae bacterium]